MSARDVYLISIGEAIAAVESAAQVPDASRP